MRVISLKTLIELPKSKPRQSRLIRLTIDGRQIHREMTVATNWNTKKEVSIPGLHAFGWWRLTHPYRTLMSIPIMGSRSSKWMLCTCNYSPEKVVGGQCQLVAANGDWHQEPIVIVKSCFHIAITILSFCGAKRYRHSHCKLFTCTSMQILESQFLNFHVLSMALLSRCQIFTLNLPK